MHLLKGFRVVVPSDALSHDIVEQMLGEVHFRISPPCWIVFLSDHISINSRGVVGV